jgi:hypothetical protein
MFWWTSLLFCLWRLRSRSSLRARVGAERRELYLKPPVAVIFWPRQHPKAAAKKKAAPFTEQNKEIFYLFGKSSATQSR